MFKDIVLNHVAIGVSVPRATGASLDSKEGENQITTQKVIEMKYKKTLQKDENLSLDEMEIEYDESHEKLVSAFDSREKKMMQASKDKMISMKKSMDEALGAKEALEAKVKKLENKLEGSISKDELEELEEVRGRARVYGVEEKFTSTKEGKGLILKKAYNKSFDDAHIDGAYSTLTDDDYQIEKAKSNTALQNADQASRISKDSQGNEVIPFSKMDMNKILQLANRR